MFEPFNHALEGFSSPYEMRKKFIVFLLLPVDLKDIDSEKSFRFLRCEPFFSVNETCLLYLYTMGPRSKQAFRLFGLSFDNGCIV